MSTDSSPKLPTTSPLQKLAGQANVNRYAFTQWLILTLVLLALATGLAWQRGLGRADATLYDYSLGWSGQVALDDILIVAIDEDSLASIGRWPWPRDKHAQLLERIAQGKPKVVAFDILFTEPEQSGSFSAGELKLKQALRTVKTVLPVTQDSGADKLDRDLVPLAALREQSAMLGHINLPLEEDGICRSVFLEEGPNQAGRYKGYEQLTVAMLKVAQNADLLQRIQVPSNLPQRSTAPWLRDRELRIPFIGPPGTFSRVSFASVLRGEIPPAFFRDKYVLVGTTAPGIDAYPTPVSGDSASMPGVEIHANILQGLMQDRMIVHGGIGAHIALAVTMTLLGCICLFVLPPRWALASIGCLVAMTFVICALLLRNQHYWLAPLATLIPLLTAYPLWSWRRLETALSFIAQEFKELNDEPDILAAARSLTSSTGNSAVHKPAPLSDVLEKSMSALDAAATRMRDLRRFLADAIEQMPNAALVCTSDGYVLIANHHARQVFESKGTSTQDAMLAYLLADLVAENVPPDFSWWHLVKADLSRQYPDGVQASDPQGADWLVHSAPCRGSDGQALAWLVSMTNVTNMRAAQRRTENTLRVLTQDIRGPLLTALGRIKLELAQHEKVSDADEGTIQLQQQLRHAVDVTDAFTRLARAETGRVRLRSAHPNTVLQTAVEHMQARAKAANINLVFEPLEALPAVLNVQPELASALVSIDTDLFNQALLELIGNALIYSKAHTTVTCSVLARATLPDATIVFEIKDQGCGIDPQFHGQVFTPFARFAQRQDENANIAEVIDDASAMNGTGLGLAFVRQLVRRHNGLIEFDSTLGVGSSFRILLECMSAPVVPAAPKDEIPKEALDALFEPIHSTLFR